MQSLARVSLSGVYAGVFVLFSFGDVGISASSYIGGLDWWFDGLAHYAP